MKYLTGKEEKTTIEIVPPANKLKTQAGNCLSLKERKAFNNEIMPMVSSSLSKLNGKNYYFRPPKETLKTSNKVIQSQKETPLVDFDLYDLNILRNRVVNHARAIDFSKKQKKRVLDACIIYLDGKIDKVKLIEILKNNPNYSDSFFLCKSATKSYVNDVLAIPDEVMKERIWDLDFGGPGPFNGVL